MTEVWSPPNAILIFLLCVLGLLTLAFAFRLPLAESEMSLNLAHSWRSQCDL